jgi:hypothetical protein
MQGRMYVVTFENVAVAAAQDLFDIAPASNKPIYIAGVTLDNVGGTADAADAQEEDLRIRFVRGFATVGSAGAAATVSPQRTGDSAAGFTARCNDTTIAVVGGGTTVVGPTYGWNTRIGSREFWPEELMWGCSSTETRLVVQLLSTPADSFQVSGTAYVFEAY